MAFGTPTAIVVLYPFYNSTSSKASMSGHNLWFQTTGRCWIFDIHPTDPTGCRMHPLDPLIQPMQRLSQWNFAPRCWMNLRIACSKRTHVIFWFYKSNLVSISMLTLSKSQARIPNWVAFWWVRFFLFLHLMLHLTLSRVQSHRSCWKSCEDPSCFGTVAWRFWPKPWWKNQKLPTSQKSDEENPGC